MKKGNSGVFNLALAPRRFVLRDAHVLRLNILPCQARPET